VRDPPLEIVYYLAERVTTGDYKIAAHAVVLAEGFQGIRVGIQGEGGSVWEGKI